MYNTKALLKKVNRLCKELEIKTRPLPSVFYISLNEGETEEQGLSRYKQENNPQINPRDLIVYFIPCVNRV